MIEAIISSLIGAGGFLSGIFLAIKTVGRKEQKTEDRLAGLESKSHVAPCPDIQEMKESLAEVKTNVSWLVKDRQNFLQAKHMAGS